MGVTVLNPNDSSIKSARNDTPILVKMYWINVYRVNHKFVERIQAVYVIADEF